MRMPNRIAATSPRAAARITSWFWSGGGSGLEGGDWITIEPDPVGEESPQQRHEYERRQGRVDDRGDDHGGELVAHGIGVAEQHVGSRGGDLHERRGGDDVRELRRRPRRRRDGWHHLVAGLGAQAHPDAGGDVQKRREPQPADQHGVQQQPRREAGQGRRLRAPEQGDHDDQDQQQVGPGRAGGELGHGGELEHGQQEHQRADLEHVADHGPCTFSTSTRSRLPKSTNGVTWMVLVVASSSCETLVIWPSGMPAGSSELRCWAFACSPAVTTTWPVDTCSSWGTIFRLRRPGSASDGMATPCTVPPWMRADTALSGSRISCTLEALGVTAVMRPISPANSLLSPAGATTGSLTATPSELPTSIVIVWVYAFGTWRMTEPPT